MVVGNPYIHNSLYVDDGDDLHKLIYCQTVLFEEQIEAIKKLSGEGSIKDALIDAVEFYIEYKGKVGRNE